MPVPVFAITRNDIASYVDTLVWVYTVIIFAYIISTWVFSFGVRVPYNRALNGVLTFLRDVTDPYLRIFRKIIPMVGPLDLSPIVAIIVLRVVGSIVVNLIAAGG